MTELFSNISESVKRNIEFMGDLLLDPKNLSP